MSKNDKNKVKKNKIISIIEYIIIFVIIFVNAVLIYKTIAHPDKTPDLFGKKAFIIISGSMIPTINIGDIVIIDDDTNVKVDDIIAFKEESVVIVHRIVNEMEINNEVMYQTKGDNNNIADENLVELQNIEGIYYFKVPFIGNIILFLYNNMFLVVIVIIVIILFRYIKW